MATLNTNGPSAKDQPEATDKVYSKVVGEACGDATA